MGEPFAAAEFVIDYALYLKFHKFQLQKGARKRFYLLATIISAIGLLLGILFFLFFGFDKDIVGLMAILIVVLALILYIRIYLPRLQYKHFKKLLEAPQKLQLFAGYFTVESESPQFSGKTSMKYEALYEAYETDEMFYMYISKYQAHLLPKAALGEEAVQELHSILHASLGYNFKF